MPDAVSRTDSPFTHCAIYTRQSVARGEHGDFTSCEAQRAACEAFVRSRRLQGWRVLPERFDDVGYSGATLDRPALLRLLDAVTEGHLDRVVTHRFDRLTRNLRHWTELAEFFERAGTELTVVTGDSHDLGAAMSSFVRNILAVFAEFERELIGERLRESRATRAGRGLRSSGRVPFGYQADPATRQLEPHPVEAEIVRDLFRLAAEGETAAAIARWANERGICTKANRKRAGGRWTGRTMLQLLRNPLYLGQRRWQGAVVPGAHPALVEVQLVERAHQKIAARRTRSPTSRGKVPLPDLDPYMLRSLLRCGGCGGSMTPSASRAVTIATADQVPRYYRCRGSAARPPCRPPVQVAARVVEQEVVRQLRKPCSFAGAPLDARAVLVTLDGLWSQFDRGATTLFVRRFVASATWQPRDRVLEARLDEEALSYHAVDLAEIRRRARERSES